ncbi:putative AAA family ATPase [Bacillus phage vB_BspM_AgentSmith]|nr:putative AAA family ATPase [Bacillus phage vB_BspM_AgentSmith]
MGIYVISAFPGLGKTYATQKLVEEGFNVSDSDSSHFNKEHFPGNYVEHIKSKIQDYRDMNTSSAKFIFVSTHKEVRDALIENGIKFVIFYPDVGSKDDIFKRYEERGSNEAFIKHLETNYDSWIEEIKEDVAIENKYPVTNGVFLYDVVRSTFIDNESVSGLV